MNTEEIPWIIFELNENFFSITSNNVVAIIKEPKITKIPNSSIFVKGIFSYRDEIYKLINLRKVFSIKSIEEECLEFFDTMNRRAEDHKNWLQELENSVTEKREFTLTTDPHKCAFGKWYDSYRDQKNLSLRVIRILDQFDKPHQKIHKIAHTVKEYITSENFQAAYKIIQDTHDKELKSMISLFDKIKEEYNESKKQTVIVMKENGCKKAIAVDYVDSVEFLYNIDQTNLNNDLIKPENQDYVIGLSKTKTEQLTLKLNDSKIIQGVF